MVILWSDKVKLTKFYLQNQTTDVKSSKKRQEFRNIATEKKNLKEGLQYMRRSLEHAEELMEMPAQEMKPLAISGETSTRYLEDNLYELLARRAVDVWKGNVWLLRQYGNLTMDFPDEMDTLEGLMNTPLKPVSEYDVVADIMVVYQTLLKRYQQLARIKSYLCPIWKE